MKEILRILIINAYSNTGGASRAARRLEACLNERTDVSTEFVSVINGKYEKGSEFLFKFKAVFNRLPGYLLSFGKAFFSTPVISSKSLIDYINNSNCDIVNLHWVNSGSLSIEDIARIRKPIAWSLHDMWAFTGGCHYSETCLGYRSGCNVRCDVIGNRFGRLLSSYYFNKKRIAYGKCISLTMIGLSSWMATEAKSSGLGPLYTVKNLPNPIDINVFRPMDKLDCRRDLGLPINKKLLLFGAMSVTDRRKGFSQLIQALSTIKDEEIALVIFGKLDIELSEYICGDYYLMGSIGSDVELAKLYSASDAMVVPSLQENLSNSIMESMACGTPVVSFDIGGNSDMIDHCNNGYLASAFSIDDLATGVRYVLSEDRELQLSTSSREKIINNFSNKVVSEKYVRLFQDILRGCDNFKD